MRAKVAQNLVEEDHRISIEEILVHYGLGYLKKILI